MNWKSGLLVLIVGLVVGFFMGHSSPAPTGYQLVLDSQYEPVAKSLIDSANNSILIGMFEMKTYNATYPLLNSLCDARARGVDVHVILENTISDNNKTVSFLKKCNVDVKPDPSDVRTHAKFLIVDGRLVLLGSTNWSFSAFYKNHEVDMLVDDPKIAEKLANYFYRI